MSNIDNQLPDDDDCISCTGVSYFSDALRLKGMKPICYGIKTTAKKKIPKERMFMLEKIAIDVKPNTAVFHIGLSQSSQRMLRMGKLPILISGIEIQKETRVVKEHEIVNKKEINGIDDTMKTVVNYVQLDMIHITQFVKKAVNRFKFSAERQWKAMGNLFNKSRDHLPQRIYMSSIRLANSCDRTFVNMKKTAKSLIGWDIK